METNRKKAKVVLLKVTGNSIPAIRHASNLGYQVCDSRFTSNQLQTAGFDVFHLYFTTDEDFIAGEWVLFGDVVMIAQSFDDRVVYDNDGNSFMKYDCKKIIATTDHLSKLTAGSSEEGMAGIYRRLPQPSKAFIEEYCEEGGIDEVDVEYERMHCGCNEFGCTCEGTKSKLKVDSHNTITIHPIKDSWSREEIEQIARKAFDKGVNVDEWEDVEAYWKAWKEQNL